MRGTIFFFAAFCLVFSNATQIRTCNSDPTLDDENVTISNCVKPPCILKKNTIVKIEQKFVPQRDVAGVKTRVSAQIAGLNLPFIGVDDKDACNQIFTSDGEPAGCPLKAGTEYTYRNQFKVMNFYPSISTNVHWSLMDRSRKVACFEVPVKITN